MMTRLVTALISGVLAALPASASLASPVEFQYVADAPAQSEGFYKASLLTDPEPFYRRAGVQWTELSPPAPKTATTAGPSRAQPSWKPGANPEDPGDTSGIPLPPAVWLFVSGLVGISVIARQRGRRR